MRIPTTSSPASRPVLEPLEPRLLLQGVLTPFEAVDPLGSLIYVSYAQDEALSAGQMSAFSFEVDAGQKVTLVGKPHEPGLDVALVIRDGAGAVLRWGNSGGAGVLERIQTMDIASSGSHSTEVYGIGGSGTYDLEVWLNTAMDDGSGDGTLGNAQEIDGSFVDLGGGADRGAVVGTFPTFLATTEDFETGLVGLDWSFYSHSTHAASPGFPLTFNKVCDYYGGADGEYALFMFRIEPPIDPDGQPAFSLNEATWTVDLSGLPGAFLSFQHWQNNDQPDPFAGPFTGHGNADGIAISADGVAWYPVWNAAEQANRVWRGYSIDLGSAASSAGLSLGPGFRIRFQQYGGYGWRGWDSLSITSAQTAFSLSRAYAFEATEGDVLSTYATGERGAAIELTLYDPQGRVLAHGESGPENVGQTVRDLTAPASGTYYVGVSADPMTGSGMGYSLMVTRNAELELEPNDATSAPQELGGAGIVTGSVGLMPMNRLFAWEYQSEWIYELDPQTGEVLNSFDNPAHQLGPRLLTTSRTLLYVSGQYYYSGGNYEARYELLECDPDTGEVLQTLMAAKSNVVVTAGNEVYVLYYNGTQTVFDVVDLRSGALLRTIPYGQVMNGIFFATAEGLFKLRETTVYRIDPTSGAETVVASLDITEAAGATVIGDELFVTNSFSDWDATFELVVYDWKTLERKRVIAGNMDPSRLVAYTVLGGGGWGGAPESDYYSVQANTGDVLTITTTTPGDGSFGNTLDPVARIYDESGTELASDDNGAPDGRNAWLRYTVPAAGRYVVAVESVDDRRGDYRLSVTGSTFVEEPFHVTDSDPVDGVRLDITPAYATIRFSDNVLLSSLDPSDLTVDGAPARDVQVINSNTVAFELGAVGLGEFDLQLAAGTVLDFAGRPVEEFNARVKVSAHAVAPAGSIVYVYTAKGSIATAGLEESFALQLDGNQTVSLVVSPSSMLQPGVELRDASGNLLGSATSPSAGKSAVLQTVAISLPGDYEVTVRGLGGSVGSYTAQVLLNASAESEPRSGVENDDLSGAQDINGSFITLAGGGERGAVLGTLESGKNTVIARDGFESYELGPAWATYVEGTGKITVSNYAGAAEGNRALVMQNSNPSSGMGPAEATWTVDLSGLDQAILCFSQAANCDPGVGFDGDFEGHYYANGIAVSVDGLHWHPIWETPSETTGQWKRYSIDLLQALAEAYMEPGVVQIRFQAYRLPSKTSFVGWDDISVAVPGAKDLYSFQMEAGDSSTVVLAVLNDAPTVVELLNGSGTVVGRGVRGAGAIDEMIVDYVAPADGRYYVRVAGAEGSDYSLVVMRNAEFSAEPHDTMTTAQDITRNGVVLGTVGYSMDRLFVSNTHSGHNDILEIDPSTGAILKKFTPTIGSITGLATTPATLLIGSDADGRIYEIDPDNGSIVRTIEVPGVKQSGLGFYADEIFVNTKPGVAVLDYATGTVKRTLPVNMYSGPIGTPDGLLGLASWRTVVLVDPLTGSTRTIGHILTYNGASGVGMYRGELVATAKDHDIVFFDLENTSQPRTITLPNNGDVTLRDVGADVSFGLDWYQFTVNAGDELVIRTATPAGGGNEFINVVDPVVELYDPDGELVAIADNNLDGRNAILDYAARTSGLYRVKVFATGIGGEYVLSVSGQTGIPGETFGVASVVPADRSELTEVPTTMTMTFSEGLALDTLSPSDVRVDGVEAPGYWVLDGRTILVDLPSLVSGAHQVTMVGGSVRDLQGTGFEGFTSTFTIPVETDAVRPLGSLVYEQRREGAITSPGGQARCSIELEANQTLTVAVEAGTGLQPMVEFYDQAGNLLSSASSAMAGEGAVLQTVAVTADGTYYLAFSGVAGTTGDFTARILINAAAEVEEYGGSANDTLASAQDLNGSFIDLGDGASRAAVVGKLVNLVEDFESGVLGSEWTLDTSQGSARIRVTNELASLADGYILVLDSYNSNWAAAPGAIWTVDLSNVSDPRLSFSYADLGSNGVVGGYDGQNGVQISANGTTWYSIFNAPDLEYGTWGQYSVDLALAASSRGISLQNPLKIRFRQYAVNPADPSHPLLSSGAAYDNISIASTNGSDFYSFQLQADDLVDLSVTGASGNSASLELLDGQGLLAASVRGAGNLDGVIAGFGVAQTGTYYVRVFDSHGPYSLLVTRNAAFDTEMNNDAAHAQDIGQTGIVLGDVGHGNNRLFVYEVVNRGRLVEIDPGTGQKIGDLALPFVPDSSDRYFGGMAATDRSVLVSGADNQHVATPIFELDARNGAVMRAIENPWGIVSAMAFCNNEIYAKLYGNPAKIVVIDYYSGQLNRVLDLATNVASLAGCSDCLLGLGTSLYRIDPFTGTETVVGTISGSSGYGLAVVGNELAVDEGYNVSFYDLRTLVKTRTLNSVYGSLAALGGDSGVVDDYYRVNVNAGDNLVLSTRTPGDRMGLVVNQVDPAIELYDANGTLVASDDNDGSDGRNARIEYATLTGGTYIVKVTASASTAGEYVLSIFGSTVGAAGPLTVVQTDPADGSVHETRPTQLTVKFSDWILLPTLEASVLTVDGQAATGVTVVDGRTVVFDLPSILAGVHGIAIAAGAIQDVQGTPIDAFQMQIVVGQFDFPVPLRPVEPLGSQVYRGMVSGIVDPSSDTNGYALPLTAGESLTVTVQPVGLGLQPGVDVYDADGHPVAGGQAGRAGSPVVVQTIRITTSETYRIVVTGVSSTVGAFDLDVVLNAAAEEEQSGGSPNNTLESAQNLNAAFRPVLGQGDVASVLGGISALPNENFDSKILGPAWTLYSMHDPGDRWLLAPYTNSYLIMRGNPAGYTLQEATRTVGLSELSTATLSFTYRREQDPLLDVSDPFDGPFTGHYNADGVAISADGITWYPVWSMPNTPDRAWMVQEIDLAAAAADAGIALGPLFQVRFQYYGNDTLHDGDRVQWDDIAITTTQNTADWYRFDPAAGQSVVVLLDQLAGSGAVVELFDDTSALVRTAHAGPTNLDLVTDAIRATDAGTWYVRVIANPGTQYSLMVVRDAIFDLEENDTLASSQDITDTRLTLGHLHGGADPIATESEPNDDGVTGDVIDDLTFADDLSGSMTLVSGTVYRATVPGTVSGTGDRDVYRILASPGDIVGRQITGSNSSYCSVYLCDRTGTLVNSPISSSGYAGDYYIVVTCNLYITVNYTLTVTLTTTHLLGDRNDDMYRVSVNPGEVMTFRTSTPSGGSGEFVNTLDPMLQLYDPTGMLVATDDNSAPDGRNAVLRYAARMAGDYTVRVAGVPHSRGEYVLSVDVQDPDAVPMWVMSVQPADDSVVQVHPARILVEFSHAVDSLTLDTTDLGVDGGAVVGVGLVDPFTVAFDITGPLQEGPHGIVVPAGAVGSTYGTSNLGFAGGFDFDALPMAVSSVTPVNGRALYVQPGQITVDFSQAVLPGTVDVSDMLIGGVSAGSVDIVDADTLVFGVSDGLLEGTYDIILPAGVLGDIYGQSNESFTSQFIYEHAPRVIASSLQEGESIPPGTLTYVASFDKPLYGAVLDKTDVLLNNGGQVLSASWFVYDPANHTLTVTYGGLTERPYTLTLLSGSSAIRSAVGWDLDGEPNLGSPDRTPSGDGVPGGNFIVHFTVDVTSQNVTGLGDVAPAGSGVKQATFDGRVNASDDVDSYLTGLEAGQTLTVVVQPTVPLRASLEILGPFGGSLTDVSADAVGEVLVVQTLRVTETGTHTLRFGGADATSGNYSVRLLVNAAVEGETYGLGVDDTLAQSQDLSARVVTGGDGAQRAAVVGALPSSLGVAEISEDFETGSLGSAWTTWSSDTGGRIRLIGTYGLGNYALFMDRSPDGTYTLNEAVWTVDLSGLTQPTLRFKQYDKGDEEHPFSGNFTDHYNADGVAISADGVTWIPILSAPGQTEGVWRSYSIDLAAQAATAGISLGPSFRIKFQQYDNYTVVSDGRGWDDIVITTPEPAEDWYGLGLTAGDMLTVSLAQLSGSGAQVRLHDDSGALLADGTAGSGDVAQMIADFTVQTSATYYVCVSGMDVSYSLVASVPSSSRKLYSMTAGGGRDAEAGMGMDELTGGSVSVVFTGLISFDGAAAAMSSNVGSIGSGLEPATLLLDLEAGERLSLRVTPDSTAAELSVQIVEIPQAQLAASAGKPVTLQGMLVPETGTYELRVGSTVATGFTLKVYQNALLEATDTTDGNEQSLDAGRFDVEAGHRGYAILGYSDAIVTVDEYMVNLTGLEGSTVNILLKGVESADLTDARVDLIGPDGTTVLASSTHPTDGAYDQSIREFLLPLGGAYTVRLTGRTTGEYVLALDSQRPGIVPGSISGQVWHDLNGNGLQQSGECGLNGRTVELVDAQTGIVLATLTTTSIDLNHDGLIDPESEQGLYGFENLEPWTYQVSRPGERGWTQTAPWPPSLTMLGNGASVVVCFGSAITGDANGDGKVDSADLAVWQRNYDPLGRNDDTFAMGDWDGNGRVDSADLALWQRHYKPLGLSESLPSLQVAANEQWVPYVPSPEQTDISVSSNKGVTTSEVLLTFPDAGYRVTDWGPVLRQGDDFSAEAQVEDWTGAAALVITPIVHDYDLGPLAPRGYSFTFKVWGHPVETMPFTVMALPPGDGNGDTAVDSADLAIWQQHYDPLGKNRNTPAMGNWDGDSDIDSADLALWQRHYNPLGQFSMSSSDVQLSMVDVLALAELAVPLGA